MNTAPQDLLLQLLEPAHRANPYPVYRQLREQAPLQLPESNLTVFASFAVLYLGEKIRWNHLAAFVCLLAAVAFTFLPKE